MKQKFIKIFFMIVSLLGLILYILPDASAFDVTDTAPPTYQVSVIDVGNNNFGRVIIKIEAYDDKNEIKLNTKLISTTAQILSTPPASIAPLCGKTPQNTSIDISGIVFSSNFFDPTILSEKIRTFYVVFGSNFGELPQGCPEWRDPNQNLLSADINPSQLELQDAAGNRTKLDLNLGLLVGKVWPIKVIPNSLCIANQAWSNLIDNGLVSYKKALKQYPNDKDFISISENFFAQSNTYNFSRTLIESQEQYKTFYSKSVFDLESVKELTPCKNTLLGSTSIPLSLLSMLEESMRDFLSAKSKVTESDQNKSLVGPAQDLAKDVKARIAILQVKYAKSSSYIQVLKALLVLVPTFSDTEYLYLSTFNSKRIQLNQIDSDLKALEKHPPRDMVISITCTKNKLSKKVTGIDPKCPNGYKKV